MKTVTTTTYVCEVCGQGYDTPADAATCEARPVILDKGVNVGDAVLICKGDYTGCNAVVTRVSVVKPGWGPKVFDHSVILSAELPDGFSRTLAFDSYLTV